MVEADSEAGRRPGERRCHSRFEAARPERARRLRLAQWVDGEACGGVHVGGVDRYRGQVVRGVWRRAWGVYDWQGGDRIGRLEDRRT